MPPRKPSYSQRQWFRPHPRLTMAHSMPTVASRVAVAVVAAVAVGAAMTKPPRMARAPIPCRRKRLMTKIVTMSSATLRLRRWQPAVSQLVRHSLSPPLDRRPSPRTTLAVTLARRRPQPKCAKPNRRPRKGLPKPQLLLRRTANRSRAARRLLRWPLIRHRLPQLSACRHCHRSRIRQSR